jgi:hypothetical protein
MASCNQTLNRSNESFIVMFLSSINLFLVPPVVLLSF